MESVIHKALPSVNKTAHSGFETQRRHHQKSKTGVSLAPQHNNMSSKNLKKRVFCYGLHVNFLLDKFDLFLTSTMSSFSVQSNFGTFCRR